MIKMSDLIKQQGDVIRTQTGIKKVEEATFGGKKLKIPQPKDFGIGKDGLHFKIGRNAKSISHVVINLSSMDLYDMKFLRVRAGKIKVVKKVKGVYNDMLGNVFKMHTGMNVRL